MASRITDKASRSQPPRFSKKAPTAPSSFKRGLKTATYIPRAPALRASASSSRARTSLLPVPVLNKTTTTEKVALSVDKKQSLAHAKALKSNQGRKTDNATVHPNLAKLLASQHPASQDSSTNDSPSPSRLPAEEQGSASLSDISDTNSREHNAVDLPTAPPKTNIVSLDPPDPVHEPTLQGDESSGSVTKSHVNTSLDNDGPTSGEVGMKNSINSDSHSEHPHVVREELNESAHSVNTGDATTEALTSDALPSLPPDPWHLIYSEMKSMRIALSSVSKRMSQLDNIERDVGSLKT